MNLEKSFITFLYYADISSYMYIHIYINIILLTLKNILKFSIIMDTVETIF